MNKKDDAQADPMADKRSEYDHKEGRLSEPKLGDEPRTVRHQVDPRRDIEVEKDQDPNGPVPRRGDPFAHQRDADAAKAAAKKEQAERDRLEKAKQDAGRPLTAEEIKAARAK